MEKISSEQLRKLEQMKPLSHKRASKNKKNMPHFAHCPRPGKSDPYAELKLNSFFAPKFHIKPQTHKVAKSNFQSNPWMDSLWFF